MAVRAVNALRVCEYDPGRFGEQDSNLELAEPDCSGGERFHWRRAAHMLRMEVDRGEVVWDEGSKLFVCRRPTGIYCCCSAFLRVQGW